jgi:hypothetical protein
MACKYTALISAVLPFGVLAVVDGWRSRSVVPVLAYVLGWSIVMAPWMVRNLFDTGNPVYPLGYRVFGARYWDEARQRQWSKAHGPREITLRRFWSSLVDVAGRSDWQSPLYLAFGPLAFFHPGSRRLVLALGCYAAYLFLTWWVLTHRLDRFWLPLLPALAILAGLGADWSSTLGWKLLRSGILAVALVVNLAYCSTALAGLNEWTGDLVFLRRDIPGRLNAPLAALDAQLPPGAKILLVGQAAVFHVNHPILYNTVFNPETVEVMASGRTPEEFRRVLHKEGVTHVYVDWKEIRRHRDPAGYGFTDFVTAQRFAVWVKRGVLAPPVRVGVEQELYRVNDH